MSEPEEDGKPTGDVPSSTEEEPASEMSEEPWVDTEEEADDQIYLSSDVVDQTPRVEFPVDQEIRTEEEKGREERYEEREEEIYEEGDEEEEEEEEEDPGIYEETGEEVREEASEVRDEEVEVEKSAEELKKEVEEVESVNIIIPNQRKVSTLSRAKSVKIPIGELEIYDTSDDRKLKGVLSDTDRSNLSSETLSSVQSKLSPYFIKWSFGHKKTVQLINLTTEGLFEIFFTASHFGVIYDYQRHSMRFLPGHNHSVTAISADASGRWLVTADAGEDTVIIVWDKERNLPVWSLYNTFPEQGTRCVQISQDGRFLAAANWNIPHVIKFWLWTYGNDEPDGTYNADPSFGVVRHIAFSHRSTEQFAVTLDKKVIFFIWDENNRQIYDCLGKLKKNQKKLGTFRECIYLDDNHTALTSTSLGQVVVWCDVPYTDPISDDVKSTNDKVHIKTIAIHKTAITCMRLVDNALIISSEGGVISFHDQQLRILYWVPSTELDPIVSVSPHLIPRKEGDLDPFTSEFDEEYSSNRSTSEEESDIDFVPASRFQAPSKSQMTMVQSSVNLNATRSIVFSDLKTKKKEGPNLLKKLPSDCSVEMQPFSIRDFVFLTTTGKIGYVSHIRRKIKYFLYSCESPVLALDCNPNKPHLITGNGNGLAVLYDYQRKELLASKKLLDSAVTCLKYSPFGHILAAGFHRGDVYLLHPVLLDIISKLESATSRIRKICFSPNSRLMAYFDDSSGVSLYSQDANFAWAFKGKYISHFKPIRDLMFEEHPKNPNVPRLFSIGEDRMLVEYDISRLDMENLSLKCIDRIEQTAIPYCFTWHPRFYNNTHFLISNNEYKFKKVEMNSRTCCKTTLGPTLDTPVKFMKVIPNWDRSTNSAKMIYMTDKHIGIRMLPLTGNPFEGMGMIGHPEKLFAIAVSHHHKYIFTTGVNDSAVLMWKLNPSCVEVSYQLGGQGLEPYLPLIDGGPGGFLYKEIEDFFYYGQILHQGEHPNMERTVTTYISLCEVPDLIRSLGFYPTDYEINNMMYELTHLKFEQTGELTNEVLFDDFVKVYLNHRPVNGLSMESINKALLAVADLTDPADIVVERTELYKTLEERAEAMQHDEVVGYLCILLLPQDEAQPVPKQLSLRDFADDVLGIDLTINEKNVRDVTHSFLTKK